MKLEPLQALYDYLLGSTRQDDTSANVSSTPCYEWAEYVSLPAEAREHGDNAAAE